MSNLVQRIITGIIGAVILIGAIYYSFWGTVSVFLIIQTAALYEFYKLLESKGNEPNIIGGLLLSIFIYGTILFPSFGLTPLILPLSFLLFIAELFRKKDNPFVNISITILGIVYITLPLSLFIVLSWSDTYHYEFILGCLFILWANDTGAYIAGKSFGKTKLFERISPNKTWEGSLGGAILAMSVAYILSIYFKDYTSLQWLLMGLSITVMGGLGDLIESMLKRSVDIKDSSGLIPGHGGFLDRFDGLIFAIPFIISVLLFT